MPFTAQSQNGMPLNVGDFVRFPNTSTTVQPPSLIGIITAISGNNALSVNVPTVAGGNTVYTNVASSTALQMAQASGPGNAESNRSY